MSITVKELERQIRVEEGVFVVIRMSEKTEIPGLVSYGKQFKRMGNQEKVKALVDRIRDILGDQTAGVVVLNSELKRIDVRSHLDKARV